MKTNIHGHEVAITLDENYVWVQPWTDAGVSYFGCDRDLRRSGVCASRRADAKADVIAAARARFGEDATTGREVGWHGEDGYVVHEDDVPLCYEDSAGYGRFTLTFSRTQLSAATREVSFPVVELHKIRFGADEFSVWRASPESVCVEVAEGDGEGSVARRETYTFNLDDEDSKTIVLAF